MRRTQDQKRFTTLEVAADWHELMIPQRSMQPSIACLSEQMNPQIAVNDTPPPQSGTLDLQFVARKSLLISRPTEGRRLSWPEHTVGYQLAQGCLQMTGSENRTAT